MSRNDPLPTAVLQALAQPVIVVNDERFIVFVNYAAEAFFGASLSVLSRQRIDDLMAFGSPITGLVMAVAERHAPTKIAGVMTLFATPENTALIGLAPTGPPPKS